MCSSRTSKHAPSPPRRSLRPNAIAIGRRPRSGDPRRVEGGAASADPRGTVVADAGGPRAPADARIRDRHRVRRHGEPAGDQRSLPRRIRRSPGAGRLHPAARQAPRLHAGVRQGAGVRSALRVSPDRRGASPSSIARGGRQPIATGASAVADVAAAIDALAALARRNRPPRRDGWREEVRAAIAYRPAAWDGARSARGRQAASGRGLPAVATPSRQPSRIGLRLRWRRVRPMGAGVPPRAASRDQRRRGVDRLRVAVRARRPPRPAGRAGRRASWATARSASTWRRSTRRFATRCRSSRWSATTRAGMPSTRSSSSATVASGSIGCELRPLRYDEVTRAIGGHGEHVTKGADLPAAIDRAHASGLPACIDIAIEGVAAPVIRRER